MNSSESDKSYRKPHLNQMESNWWLKLRYYFFYILRESTAFFMIWTSLVLMFGVVCSHINEMGQNEFYRFIFFLQHPVVIVINTLALLSALIHSLTWFNLAPKAMNIIIAGKKTPNMLFTLGLWCITIIISTIMLLLIFGYFK
ncbi:fumarate reductase subunit C [Orbus mooreae]|uniref:fumarate reductase subunit C n=1 Tax=Orbus mooreae TaxID=3074107 RepID=UPI00370DC34F